ncbi:MAG: M48 family metallopeptidase [Gemmatimonadota bacterium]
MTEHDPPPGGPSSPESLPGGENAGSPSRKILEDISSRSWEHPADRAALHGLRGIPVFDEVLRKLFGIFGEKPIRLAFQANSVEVSPRQFPRVHRLYEEVIQTLDAPKAYPLFVSQTPVVNAGAYGMERPFILLNSGTVRLLDDDELQYVLAHEVGHVLSGHVLYRTMMAILLQLADRGFPIVGLAARGVLVALLEWYRRSELSSDRAGLLGVQDPKVVFRAMMKMAGGGTAEETEVSEFISQAEAYRESEDLADSVFKVLNILGSTHPFYVLRVSELRSWIETGAYDRILRGEYPRRGDPAPGYVEELGDAAKSYEAEFREFVDEVASAARKMRDSILESLREGKDRPGRGGW